MSRKADSRPAHQKYKAAIGCPWLSVTSRTTSPKAPCSPARSIAITGKIVRKMQANSLATSCIGNQLNSLSRRTVAGVNASEASASSTSRASRTRFCNSSGVPSTDSERPGCHSPDISTAATAATSSKKLILPSIRILPSGS